MNDRTAVRGRADRLVDAQLSDIVTLVMPLRGGMWYAMVKDEGLEGRADMIFGTRASAEAWVLDVLEGVALERARSGEELMNIDVAWLESAEAA